MRTLVAIAACVIATATAACGAPSGNTTSATAPSQSPIARLHKAKCGACHVRVEPGQRTRAQLQDAFTRHRTRAHLTDDQWAQMIDYLAAPDAAGTGASP